MKLVGYILPYKTFIFATPVYSCGLHLYYHEVDSNYRIRGFYRADESYYTMIGIDNDLEFTKGSNGAIVFAGEKGHIIVDNYKQALYEIDKYLSYRTKENEYLNVKEDLEYFKNLI